MKYWIWLTCLIFANVAFCQHWQPVADYPGTSRDDGTNFTIGNKVYCGLGMNAWFGLNGDFHVFDLETEHWSTGVAMPTGNERQYANGFAHHGVAYVFGGIDGSANYRNDLWKFDPSLNLWTAETNLPATGRAGAVCFVIADTAYFVGGKSTSADALDEVWGYDLVSQTWSQKANFNAGMWRGVAFSWNGKGIVGLGKAENNQPSGQFYVYSPEINSWETAIGLTMEPVSYCAATQIGNRAFLYGGMDVSGNYSNSFTRLDLETFELHSLAPFPSDPRRGSMAFSGNDEFYITTGVSAAGRLNETWKAGYVLSQKENEIDAQNILVFPNPSAGSLRIESKQSIQEISICALSGEVVFERQCNDATVHVEPHLPSGIYLLKVKGQGLNANLKISFL